MESSDDSKKSFLKYVFNFDNDTKSELLNVLQFAILSIIPVVLLNKGISKYIPEVDEKKSSLEIVAEILIQIVVMCLGLFIINRIITYLPTYSGEKYPEHSLIYAIMPVLMIILSLQTRLGEKVSILSDRVVELWEGKPSTSKQRGKPNSNVKVSQPLSTRGPITSQTSNASAMQQAMYTDGTSINTLPTNDMSNGGSQNTLAPQQLPNYNNMYEKDDTPLVNAATPGGQEGFNEPMAANSVLGGGFGSSW
jgi:hypothetical protein